MTNVKRASNKQRFRMIQAFKPKRNLDIEVAKKYFETLDTSVSLGLYLCLVHGDHRSIAEYKYDPRRELRFDLIRDNLAASSLLRKYKGLKTQINTKEVAIQSLKAGELQCAATNARFRDLSKDPSFKGSNVWLLNALTRKIEKILGTYRREDFFSLGSWGPGSSIGISGQDTGAIRKFRCERQITPKLYTLVKTSLVEQYPLWFPSEDVVDRLACISWSKLLTVDKNALTDRTIFVEAGLNTWFQKSLGASIRSCLKRHGYDLNSTERSHDCARRGSITGAITTVDFENASNTIAYQMIQNVVCDSTWFTLLDYCRTPCYSTDKGVTLNPFEMFSSMGNGFTFELESLVFVAAAEAVSDYLGIGYESISVHGDDITLDSQCFPIYCSFCEFLGFKINSKKTFSTSSFRESCGSYFFYGFDVKPYFLKEKSNDAKSIFRLANGVTSVAHCHRNRDGRDIRFLPLHRYLIDLLPKEIQLFGTVDQGDVVIHVDFDECCPVVRGDGYEGYLVPSLLDIPVNLETASPAVLLARLWYPSEDMAYGNRSNLRNVTKRALKPTLVHRWYNHGEWN
jgi:hypothetical protein